MGKHGKNFTVTTDKPDYAPGDDAVFTASKTDKGSTVEFLVAHVNAGDDGIYGTEDDLYTYDLTGTGLTWSVTDGGEDDADGLLNGVVVTSWHVNLDAAYQAFIVSAIDVETGETLTAFFTDAPPDVGLAAVDLTVSGNSGAVNGVVYQAIPTGSGTGNFPAFVQIQDNPTEQGYNTDARPQQFDENNSATHNHSILLSDIPIIIGDGTNGTVAGVAYRVFLYDSNEGNGPGDEFLSLDQFQIYQAGVGNLTNLTPGAISDVPNATNDMLIYDLDAGGDKWIALDSSLSSGSGVSDGRVLVPNSLFINDGAHNYVYLYSAFGGQGAAWSSSSGFEEWALGAGSAVGSISGTKFQDADGNLATTGDRTPLQNWTIYIDSDNDNIRDAGEIFTTTNASGNYTFNLLLPGTYTIREEVQAGWHQLSPTGPDEHTIVLDAGENDTAGNDFINSQDNPALNIVKNATVTGTTANATTDVITYSYTLTNTGNVAISGIVLTDDNGTPGNTSDDFSPTFVSGDADSDSQLDLTETWTYTRTKSVTQAMLDAGTDIVNIVTADGAGSVPADTDDATVDVVQNKALNIEKNAAVTGTTADATTDVITYSYTLTNTGNAAISGIVLTDDNGTPGNTSDDFSPSFVGGDTDGDSALDVGETWTYSRTKNVTQAMLDAGNDIVNIVTADGAGNVPADTDDATVDVVQNKALNIEKNAAVTGTTADSTSDVITYSYTLTNTGNAAISGIVLTDDNGTPGNTSDDFSPSFVGGDTDGDSALDVGETWTYSRTKSVTQAMLDAGTDIVNIVTADGAGEVPADTDDATVDVVQSKALNIEKNASVTGTTANATSDVITYSYTLTNTGNAAISGIVLTDDNGTPGDTSDDFSPSFVGGDTDGDSALDVGETWTYSRTKAVTQAMLDAGTDIVNIVTADGAGDVPSDTDDATVDVVQSKALNIEKNAAVTGTTADATTDVITYSYTLTNTGNAAISGIVLTDDNGTPGNTSDDFSPSFVGGDTDGDSALDVGETWTYSRTKTVTQAMLDAGTDIVNIVTADGAGDVPADTDDATVDVVQGKALNIEKNASVTGDTANSTSDVITYSYTLTNTGNTAISGIVLTDDNGTPGDTSDDFSPSFVGGDTDGDSALDVGETWTYSRTKNVTQAMLDAGSDIVNIVTADDGAGGAPADTDDATVDVVQSKALNIEKNAAVTGDTANSTSDVITYSYTLTNTGNAAISGIVLTDDNGTPGDTSDDFSPSFVGGDTDGDSALDVGETWTYSRTKSVTQAMLDAGTDIVNIVTADGAGDVPSDTDDATVDVVQSKALNIEKNASVTGDTADSTSDVITYGYTLTNTGNAAISGIVLTDDNGTPGDTSDDFSPSFVGGDTDGDSALDVGETWTYSRTKSVTQAMLDAGSDIVNIVTADGAGDVPSDTDDATVDVVQSKALNIEKNASVTGDTANSTSDVITYSYTLTNTGNAAISGIVLTDDNGTPGDTSDDFSPSFIGGDTDGDSALDVGETWTYSRTKSVTQAMLDAGIDIVNIVTADGAGEVPADTDDATVDVVQGKSLNIEKNASVTGDTANSTSDVITYSYTLTNTGNVAISGIVLTDDNGTPGDTSDDFSPSFVGGDTDGDSALDVGETWTYSRTKSVTQAMLDAGSDIVNIVTADDGPDGAPADTDDATVDVVQSKALNIEKNASVTGDTADSTSDVITYSYTLTNTGNAAISGIVLTDDNGTPGNTSDDFSPSFVGGDTDGDSALDVGETWTYSRTKAVTQAMLDAGTDIVNIVTADGAGDVPSDTDDATVDVVQSKALNVEKNASVTGDTANSTSDVITYSYTLTNTGNAAISGIVLTDDNGTPGNTSDDFSPSFVGGDTDGDSALDVGETWTYSRTKSVTQAMLDAGTDIVNIVTADGAGDVPSDTDDATVDVVQSKALNVEKNATVTGGQADSTSDVITYSYTLTNTGNAAISGIVLTDDNGTPGDTSDDFSPSFIGGDTDGDSALDVGETWTYSRTKAVTQDMLDEGTDIVNIVTADGPEDTPSDTDDATVDVVQRKSLNIEKNADVNGGTADVITDVITYSYTLTNTGNTAIAGIALTDDNGTPGDTSDDFSPSFIGGDTDNDSELDVGETWTYSRTKNVTQEMLNAGNDIVNIVTADDGEGGAPADTDDATVDVVKPAGELDITKVVVNIVSKGKHADKVGDVITYKIVVDNTGDTPLTGVVVTDKVEEHASVVLNTKTGDVGNDGILGANETWTYTYDYTLTHGDLFNLADDNRLHNTATVVTDQTLPDSASAAADLGPGVKTYGQWSISSYQKFWDGIANNETPSQTVSDGFPMSDITRPPYANPDTDAGGIDEAGKVFDPVTSSYKLGVLVGDWNLNGETDAGEQTLFYTPAEAVAIMTASSTTVNADARYLLARELLASWLNYQAGNPVVDLNEGDLGDALDAQDAINWAISFLQARTPDEIGGTPGEGSLTLNAAAWKLLKTSPLWTTGIDGGDLGPNVDGVSPVPFFDDPANDGDIPAGTTLWSYLNEYNNDGTILGVHIAIE